MEGGGSCIVIEVLGTMRGTTAQKVALMGLWLQTADQWASSSARVVAPEHIQIIIGQCQKNESRALGIQDERRWNENHVTYIRLSRHGKVLLPIMVNGNGHSGEFIVDVPIDQESWYSTYKIPGFVEDSPLFKLIEVLGAVP